MSAINFPNNPSINDEFTQGEKLWRWNGFRWRAIPASLINIRQQIAQANAARETVEQDLAQEAQARQQVEQALTSAEQTISSLEQNKAELEKFTTVISTTDTWSGSPGIFTLNKTVSGILSTDDPIVDIDLDKFGGINIEETQAAWGLVYFVTTQADQVTFYATEAPEFPVNVTVRFKVVR
jgi:DNA repair exonuclease SbcCD ATPase subunit